MMSVIMDIVPEAAAVQLASNVGFNSQEQATLEAIVPHCETNEGVSALRQVHGIYKNRLRQELRTMAADNSLKMMVKKMADLSKPKPKPIVPPVKK
jgi:hypothetical protein